MINTKPDQLLLDGKDIFRPGSNFSSARHG